MYTHIIFCMSIVYLVYVCSMLLDLPIYTMYAYAYNVILQINLKLVLDDDDSVCMLLHTFSYFIYFIDESENICKHII